METIASADGAVKNSPIRKLNPASATALNPTPLTHMELIEHPYVFKEGVRILMRVRRNKDGAGNTGGDRHSKKLITEGPEEFDEALEALLKGSQGDERIYATVDSRDWDKAIREFKRRQLEHDYGDDRSRHGFYRDGFNQVVSALQGSQARATSLFLFDCDSATEYEVLRSILYGIEAVAIVHAYETKNGGHIITAPFEYPKYLNSELHHLLKKNAMMLWAY